MIRKGRKQNAGFTLVELMIVVAIIGILAAVAIPAFSKYIKKSRTTEAVGTLNKIWQGAVAYYEADKFLTTGVPLAKQFPGNATPEAKCCGQAGMKCPPNNAIYNTDLTWAALNFSLADAHYYRPMFTGDGSIGTNAKFTAVAEGDLDCDGVLALFRRVGQVNQASGDAFFAQDVVGIETE